MTTSERELTEPVDLATPDGKALNPAAKGWSRRPLHRANLRGGWGRTKRWDYWAILAGDLVVSSVYADVDYLGLADVWWVDLATQRDRRSRHQRSRRTRHRAARGAGHRAAARQEPQPDARHQRRRDERRNAHRRVVGASATAPPGGSTW